MDWALLARHAYRDARARFGNRPELEDLVQDALVLLLEQERRIEHPRAWIGATIWRLLANRNRAFRISLRDSSVEARAAVSVADPDLRLDLASAARGLAPLERRLLIALAEGLSHVEIADRLGIGWKSVGTRVQRLRRKLRRLLNEDPCRL